MPLSQIELCNSLFLPSVARLERVSIILSRGDGEFLEEAPEGGRVVGRVQKSVTKWSLIAWKTAPRSGHRSLVGVRPAGACVRCAPTSASRAGGAFWLPGRPGGLTSPPWSPRGALGLACPGRMPPQRREWGSEALLEFHQKSCLNPGVIFFLSFFFKFTPADCGSSAPTPVFPSAFLSWEMFTPGRAFLGDSPHLPAPGVAHGESKVRP